MIVTPVLSQRDPRWSSLLLGTSKTSKIGLYGCAITCLTMLAGLNNVAEVNKAMVDHGAFWDEDLAYWVKINQAIPNLKFVWRNWGYDNDKVREWIYQKNTPVIVEVDAGPIGGTGSHFVLYVGDQKCVDPWTGKVRATSDFPDVLGFVLFEVVKPVDIIATIRGIINGTGTDTEKIAAIKKYV